VHRKECKAWQRITAQGRDWVPTPVRALVQVLLRKEVREAFDDLNGNVQAFRRDGERWEDLRLQAVAGCFFAGLPQTEEQILEAVEILCKVSNREKVELA
jgi:hypothetical protein